MTDSGDDEIDWIRESVGDHEVKELLQDIEVREVIVEQPLDIPMLEAGYELLAEEGHIYADILRHDEPVNVVRGYGEITEEKEDEIRRRGSGGSVPHGDTDCLNFAAPTDYHDFDHEVAWKAFVETLGDKLHDAGADSHYVNGRDILVQRGSEKDPESDPQVAGTSVRKDVNGSVMRACVKGREDETMTPELEGLLEHDYIIPENYADLTYFMEDETGTRLRDLVLQEEYESCTVEEFLRGHNREGIDVYDECRQTAEQTQNKEGVRYPESCVLGFR